MKIKILIIFIILIMSHNIYSEENDIITLVELLPDLENKGIDLLYEYTNIKDDIGIIHSGWIDIVGDNRNTEFYIKFYVEQTRMYYIIILSIRGGVLYYKSWQASNEQFNIIFFKRNNKPYVIIDYRGGSGRYYCFSIFEFKYRHSLFNCFSIIFEKDLGFDGYFEIVNNKILLYKYETIYTLQFIDNRIELIKNKNK